MGAKDKKVDDYIAKRPDFAKPILNHLRELFHKAHPAFEEKIKWGVPSFDHKGIVANMAAFKEHCALVFWKASLMKDPHKIFAKEGKSGMGHLGKIKSLKDLPSDKILIQYIKEAVNLNENGIKLPSKKENKKDLEIPSYFKSALKSLPDGKKAWEIFENFSYSNKKEYIDWLNDAKTESTRKKRLETAVKWISEGKIRNWKYVKK